MSPKTSRGSTAVFVRRLPPIHGPSTCPQRARGLIDAHRVRQLAPDLKLWDPDLEGSKPFYLELFGETEPLLDGRFAELATASKTGQAPTAPRSSVYEYWWTIGHEGRPPAPSGSRLKHWTCRATRDWIGDRLEDHAATVSVFFPTNGGWRVNEVAASVKYMSSVPHDPTLAERASGVFTTAEPLMQDASKLVSLVQPAVGGVASKSAQTLDALAQMKISQVPQVGGYAWGVSKVTTVSASEGVSHGVRWSLPKRMFRELGASAGARTPGWLEGPAVVGAEGAIDFAPPRVQNVCEPASPIPQFHPETVQITLRVGFVRFPCCVVSALNAGAISCLAAPHESGPATTLTLAVSWRAGT